jgi:hypothetical protein
MHFGPDRQGRVGDEPVLLGHTLGQAGASSHRNVAQAEQYYDEALAIQRQCGRTKWLADALNAASSMRREAGDLQTSRALSEEGSPWRWRSAISSYRTVAR